MEQLELLGVLMREFDVHAYPRTLIDPHDTSGGLEAWLPWEDRFLFTSADAQSLGIESVPIDRLGCAVRAGEAVVTVRVAAPNNERLLAFAQALIDHEADTKTLGVDPSDQLLAPVGTLEKQGTQATAVVLDAIVQRALRILAAGDYGAPMRPVSSQADVLATLLSDALGQHTASWDALMHHVVGNPELIDVAGALLFRQHGD